MTFHVPGPADGVAGVGRAPVYAPDRMHPAPASQPFALTLHKPWGRVFVRRVGLGIAVFSLLVLLDWHPASGTLRGLLPGVVMKPLAALAFVLTGLVLANEARRVPWPAVSVLLSATIAAAGAASLHADLTGVALASDGWFPDPDAAITSAASPVACRRSLR